MTAIPAGTPRGRDLDVRELRELVAGIAADPEGWLALVRADTAERHFEQLWLDDHVGVWVITWARGNDTGFHDHDLSSRRGRGRAGRDRRGAPGGRRTAAPRAPRRRRGVRVRRLPRPSDAQGRRRARGIDPRVLAAAVADGRVRGRRRRRPVPALDLVGGGVAPRGSGGLGVRRRVARARRTRARSSPRTRARRAAGRDRDATRGR